MEKSSEMQQGMEGKSEEITGFSHLIKVHVPVPGF